MARRRRAERRRVLPDPKFRSVELARFINKVMIGGKKTVAQRVVYDALDMAERQGNRPGIDIFRQALVNATPALEVRSRRVGGATYQVPRDVRPERREALSMRWIVQTAEAGAVDPCRSGWQVNCSKPHEAKATPSEGRKISIEWPKRTAHSRTIAGRRQRFDLQGIHHGYCNDNKT